MQKRNVVVVIAVAGLVAVGYQGCGKGFTSANEQAASIETDPGLPNPVPSAAPSVTNLNRFTITQPAAITSNLGLEVQVPITITGDSTYSGTVNLSVIETELAAIDTGAAITFTFSPASVTLSPGVSGSAVLTVTIPTNAPSFSSSLFHVQGADSVTAAVANEVSVPLQVVAAYDIYMDGPATPGVKVPEKFSIAVGSITSFISHSEGLTVRFNNMDSEVHLVHSSGGPIPHESTTVPYAGTTIGLPPSTDGGKTPGGIYTNVVKPGTTTEVSQVYCHDHESGKYIRTLQFNVPVKPVTPPTPVNNPNATYTYLNTNVFKATCTSCHNPTTLAGDIDLSTYATVSAYVTKGNPMISPIYVDISGTKPSMPENASPLSATLVQDVSDWITNGALNN